MERAERWQTLERAGQRSDAARRELMAAIVSAQSALHDSFS
jgi:hypothetical protein